MSGEAKDCLAMPCDNVRHHFSDFCRQTILHGWHYLAEKDSFAERFLAANAANSGHSSLSASPRANWQARSQGKPIGGEFAILSRLFG